jgi:membrane dipeptidase
MRNGIFNIDLHLDLSMNALEWNRNLRLPSAEINLREKGKFDLPGRALSTVSLPELRKGRTGIVVATQIARYVSPENPLPGWHSPEQAWAQTQGQLAWYQAMVDAGEMEQIKNLADFEKHLSLWNDAEADESKPVGFILSLEGADSLVSVEHLERAYHYGLRALGPAHYGPGRYANGTDATGKMNAKGIALLKKMESLRIILDVTHLCDDTFWQALEHFNGPIWASHNNCRAIVDHNRQFSDEMIRALISRKAIIGAAMDAWMIVPGWQRRVSDPKQMNCNLEKLVDHIDHICQLAGNTNHICIGSDLDGGYGREQSPYDIETIADLQKFPSIMLSRGYTDDDINKFMSGNVVRFIRDAWK